MKEEFITYISHEEGAGQATQDTGKHQGDQELRTGVRGPQARAFLGVSLGNFWLRGESLSSVVQCPAPDDSGGRPGLVRGFDKATVGSHTRSDLLEKVLTPFRN